MLFSIPGAVAFFMRIRKAKQLQFGNCYDRTELRHPALKALRHLSQLLYRPTGFGTDESVPYGFVDSLLQSIGNTCGLDISLFFRYDIGGDYGWSFGKGNSPG